MESYAYLIVALVIVIAIHEAAHGWVALKLGDPTAKAHGRVTLNPLAHLDFLGTIMLFMVGFGWGKPVPVNPANFKNPVKDSAIVSLAGPASNFLTALVVSVPINYLSGAMPIWLEILLITIFDLSILLGIFNLLPFPPLDGSKIFALFVPKNKQAAYFRFLEKNQSSFLIFLILDIIIIRRVFGFSILWMIIGNLFTIVRSIILLGG
jgi:Zn-dependent protease